MFLAATYENKATRENCGVVITACFSGDSRYLYAVILGRLNGKRFSLVQYDLETLEAVTLYLDWTGDTILLGRQGMVPLACQIKE